MHGIASGRAAAVHTWPDAATDEFGDAVMAGLSQPQKSVPARFLYDRQGSQLFDAITEQPEYYPCCAETQILRLHSPEIAQLTSKGRVLVEFGSGSSTKTPLLLDQIEAAAYVPIDISERHLGESASILQARYPGLDILPVSGDFTQHIFLPPRVKGKPSFGFFPGSTIGNLTPAAAASLLRQLGLTLGADAYLGIGIDLRKDPERLRRAYNESVRLTRGGHCRGPRAARACASIWSRRSSMGTRRVGRCGKLRLVRQVGFLRPDRWATGSAGGGLCCRGSGLSGSRQSGPASVPGRHRERASRHRRRKGGARHASGTRKLALRAVRRVAWRLFRALGSE